MFKGIKQPSAPPLPPMVPLTRDHIVQTAGTYVTKYLGILSIYPDNDRLFAESPVFGNLKSDEKRSPDNR